jgi:hypothetical protein
MWKKDANLNKLKKEGFGGFLECDADLFYQ